MTLLPTPICQELCPNYMLINSIWDISVLGCILAVFLSSSKVATICRMEPHITAVQLLCTLVSHAQEVCDNWVNKETIILTQGCNISLNSASFNVDSSKSREVVQKQSDEPVIILGWVEAPLPILHPFPQSVLVAKKQLVCILLCFPRNYPGVVRTLYLPFLYISDKGFITKNCRWKLSIAGVGQGRFNCHGATVLSAAPADSWYCRGRCLFWQLLHLPRLRSQFQCLVYRAVLLPEYCRTTATSDGCASLGLFCCALPWCYLVAILLDFA
mmetsp:Transcript_20822/g.45427  ORF Transcript_20822/g.45427 Transcript_20822/m.45427 type:complete len:271 (-) Transcript_20822:2023-2835(-)